MVQRRSDRLYRRKDAAVPGPGAAAGLSTRASGAGGGSNHKSKVISILTPRSRERLKRYFKAEEMEALFANTMADRYEATRPYIEALRSVFHHNQPRDKYTVRYRLSDADRERVILGILASRGEVKNLGIHIYVALMLRITPSEIADIIFLAGVYSGVPAVSDGLDTMIKVLQLLEDVAKDPAKATGDPLLTEPNMTAVFIVLSKNLQL
jgi:alkylhydroperoxidase/carboxymuconolactone decarboxylase family protein YurZ